MVALPFPLAELSGQFLPSPEVTATGEVLLVASVAPLDLAIGLRAVRGDPLVDDPLTLRGHRAEPAWPPPPPTVVPPSRISSPEVADCQTSTARESGQ